MKHPCYKKTILRSTKTFFFSLRDFYIMSLPKETKIQYVNAEKATLWSTRAVIRCLAYNLCKAFTITISKSAKDLVFVGCNLL